MFGFHNTVASFFFFNILLALAVRGIEKSREKEILEISSVLILIFVFLTTVMVFFLGLAFSLAFTFHMGELWKALLVESPRGAMTILHIGIIFGVAWGGRKCAIIAWPF